MGGWWKAETIAQNICNEGDGVMNNKKKRLIYLMITIMLLIVEVLIARYVHDAFIRPYVGDMLVVILIYTFVRIIIPEKIRLLPFYIFLFAAGVEVLQYFEIVKLLGLEDNQFMSTLIGSVFDLKDIACYGVGCLLLGMYELARGKSIGV